eukprot:12592989-Prorocentrum_lima.AAC.1
MTRERGQGGLRMRPQLILPPMEPDQTLSRAHDESEGLIQTGSARLTIASRGLRVGRVWDPVYIDPSDSW